MTPKKKTIDKVPAGTGDAADSGSTSNVIGGNNPTIDPGKNPSKMASAISEANTIRPTTRNTCVTDQLAHLASEWGTSENPTQTPNPHDGSGDPLLPKTYSDYTEPSERSVSANPDPEELVLGGQIQEMLDNIKEHMDEGKLSVHPRDPHKDPNNEDFDPHPERPSNWLNVNEESTNGQHNIDPELIQSTDGSNNRSNPKQALSTAQTELLAKTTILERLYADQAPADHLNQAATAAQSTHMEYE
ncbi:hypothetical protein M422DRAFT_242367 [Sphaerobolus stellatus SS14]|nr:hypothetical protein M422DRAFT_242367 [Sphaerobolus stellatus SS14]